MPCRKQVHSSTKSAAEYWVPAFAGMTGERAAMLCRRALEHLEKPVKRTVVYCGFRLKVRRSLEGGAGGERAAGSMPRLTHHLICSMPLKSIVEPSEKVRVPPASAVSVM